MTPDSAEQINTFIVVFGIMISLAILLFLQTSGDRDSRLNRLFARLMVCNTAAMVCSVLVTLFSVIGIHVISRIAAFLSYALINLLLPLLADYVFALIRRNTQISRAIPRFIYGFFFIWLISLVISQFGGMYYYFDENNIYQPGEYFWVSQIYGALSLPVITAMILRYRKSLDTGDALYLLVYPCISVIAVILQVFMLGEIAVIYITNTFFALFCYGGIQARQAKAILLI